MIIIKNLRKEKPSKPYDIRVDRKSILGNPFYLSKETDRNKVCDAYHTYFNKILLTTNRYKGFKQEVTRIEEIYKKYGKLNLFCWCVPKRCHAETIKQYLKAKGEIK